MYCGSVQRDAPAPFTASEAPLVPQSDRMGKARAWELLHRLRKTQLGSSSSATEHTGALDLTDGALFPWRVWLCNLGHRTNEAVGDGLVRVMLQMGQGVTITRMLSRADGSSCTLACMRRNHSDGGHSYSLELREQ